MSDDARDKLLARRQRDGVLPITGFTDPAGTLAYTRECLASLVLYLTTGIVTAPLAEFRRGKEGIEP